MKHDGTIMSEDDEISGPSKKTRHGGGVSGGSDSSKELKALTKIIKDSRRSIQR
jgi:hypothetical protein